MATLWTHKDSNIRKTWLLMAAFLVVVIGIGWGFSYVYNSTAILFVAVIFSVAMSVTSYWYSDKIVIASTHAREIKKEQARELHNIVENLAITAGLPKPGIYLVDSPQPNAFATGRDPEHAIVAVTTGILERLNRSELEGVLAHELSHVGNRDMLVSTIVVVLVGFLAILSDIFMRSLWFGGMRSRDRNNNGGGVMIIIGIALALLSPLVGTIIKLAISRKREFLADASGALLTRYPEGLASALEKISQNTHPMKQASRATAHLWLADPYGTKNKKRVSWFTKLFMTHPPVAERVAALRGMKSVRQNV